MDPKVWDYLQSLNKDVATLMAQVEWLTWWVRALIGANLFTGLTAGSSLFILIRNNKNSGGKASSRRRKS